MADRIELLAPAGDRDALVAAVQNGADAVYLGFGAFNARRRAGNFDSDGLREAVDYCHARGVHVHVTLNTLVRQDELDALYDAIRTIYQSGADAVIVQDFGVARAVRMIAPELELHASTQMAAHNRQAAEFLKKQGFDRVVLAREATYADMGECAACGVDVEVFAHGALCVACSGQCLMSSVIGGRSGNRGLCAQPCRLPWTLDGREGYLLSTKDLCAIDDLDKLQRAGVRSLKLEGRLKRPEYVAVTVAAYRRALDRLQNGAPSDNDAAREELRQMFNRGGFTRGYAPGMRETELMYPERPNHVGVEVGSCRKNGEVILSADVLTSDALALRRRGKEDVPVKLSGTAGECVRCKEARAGDALMRSVSEKQMQAARESMSGEHRGVRVAAKAALHVGKPAYLEVASGEHTASASGDVIERATGRPFDPERAKAQLQKTGGTAYTIDNIAIDADADAFVPASLLNALRRNALEALDAMRIGFARENGPVIPPRIAPAHDGAPVLYAQSDDPDVLKRALACGADVAVFAPNDLRPEVLDFADLPERFSLCVPAVLTAGALDALYRAADKERDRIDATILTNVGQLGLDWPGRHIAGFMLNAANDHAVARFAEWGMDEYTPSVELNARQIDPLHGDRQIILWGRLPLMHLRHCPLRATHNMPGLHADCRHCDACALSERLNGKQLIDRKDTAFPLERVAMPGGCVVRVLNSVPLMPLKKMDKLPKAGGYRLLLRSDEPIEAIVKVCRAAIDGAEFKALPEWPALEDMPTTTAHYFRGVE